jgi:hypothetical protein
MEQVAIAALTPELPAVESKQFRAVVTLIWPYSSSARQFALLLGDPNFRRAGQVRARFAGSSAKAIASTGVGIGDELVLSLRGAEFVQDGPVSTPGKSIDWELSYTQTLSAHVIRNGTEIASLDLNNVAPTPAPLSPVRRQLSVAIDEPHQWSSPAFIKRTRLSEGPIFEAGYDPFNDDTEDRHDRKRRRKSYRDWNAWTYSGRTPSPEKDDAEIDDYVTFGAPSVQLTNLPGTPVSLSKPEPLSTPSYPLPQTDGPAPDNETRAAEVIAGNGDADYDDHARSSPPRKDFVRDADYYDLYAGPNEFPPLELQDTFEGDTVPNTEDEDGISSIHVASYINTVDSDTEDSAEETTQTNPDNVEVVSVSNSSNLAEGPAISTEQYNVVEAEDTAVMDNNTNLEYEQLVHERSGTIEDLVVLDEVPNIVMPPPPALPLLQTNFHTSFAPGLLTPLGQEPSSPTLLPLDSATLPMPSPFPGERGGNALSYLDHVGSSLPDMSSEAAVQQLNDDEEYVVESSFYSSISASNAPAFHATHESAFTDVRFTFGMDGSTFSRPANSSKSDEVQNIDRLLDESVHAEEVDSEHVEEHNLDDVDVVTTGDLPKGLASSSRPGSSPPQQQQPEVIELFSDLHSGDTNDDHLEFEPAPQTRSEFSAANLETFDVEQYVNAGTDQGAEKHIDWQQHLQEEIDAQIDVDTGSFEYSAVKDMASELRTADQLSPASSKQSIAAIEWCRRDC